MRALKSLALRLTRAVGFRSWRGTKAHTDQRIPCLTSGWLGMRVRLKGIHSTNKRLSDGSVRTYYYAWRGGPALPGKPGAPEFVAAYNSAIAGKVGRDSDRLGGLLIRYQQSDDYRRLAESTRKDYSRNIASIHKKFADFPLAALSDRRTRSIFLAWRDELATSSPRQADYQLATLASILSWARDRGIVTHNPCERPGRAYRGSRVDRIWSDADEQLFYAAAPKQLHLPMLMALWTGQRQGDLLRLPWSAYDGRTIRLRQGKTGASIAIPVSSRLKSELAATPRVCPIILVNAEGQPWTAHAFRRAWYRACRAAGIEGLTFHDLRGTAVTRLAIAGCTQAEIAAFTGHSLSDVHQILDRHYLSRDPALAENAVRKLERQTK